MSTNEVSRINSQQTYSWYPRVIVLELTRKKHFYPITELMRHPLAWGGRDGLTFTFNVLFFFRVLSLALSR